MDKETLSNYGWITICVLVLAVMIALATPFGEFVGKGFKATYEGLSDTTNNALGVVRLSDITGGGNDEQETGTGVSIPAGATYYRFMRYATAPDCTHNSFVVETEWNEAYCPTCDAYYMYVASLSEVPGDNPVEGVNYITYSGGYIFEASEGYEQLTAPSSFPATKNAGDRYVYGDYEYYYGGYMTEGFDDLVFTPDETSVWSVHALTNKATYGEILTSINGASVTNMTSTFWNCSALTTAPTIPNTITTMDYTFYRCSSLTTVIIPNSVTSMNGTFQNCTALTDLSDFVIPNSVTSMEATFEHCTNLTDAPAIPNGVTSMYSTFHGCTSLTTVSTIPSSVEIIDLIFADCTNLTGNIAINATPTSYSSSFTGTTQPITLTGSGTNRAEIAATANNGNVTVG